LACSATEAVGGNAVQTGSCVPDPV